MDKQRKIKKDGKIERYVGQKNKYRQRERGDVDIPHFLPVCPVLLGDNGGHVEGVDNLLESLLGAGVHVDTNSNLVQCTISNIN